MEDVKYWLSSDELKGIYSSEYWNDILQEQNKEWWVTENDDGKYLEFLKASNLLKEFSYARQQIEKLHDQSLVVADLAAGTGWATALLSSMPNVREVHAVEISEHRITSLFEQNMKILSGDDSKVHRYVGSFYDIKLPDETFDIVFMSQAFHHASAPLDLIRECRRVLKKNGLLILTGEHHIGLLRILKRFVSNIIKAKKVSLNFFEMFPPDDVTGDHYYRKSDYQLMFFLFGFKTEYLYAGGKHIVYVARKI